MNKPLSLLCILALGGAARAQSLVTVPNANTAVEGANALNTMIRSQPRTLQLILGASELISVLHGDITGLTFRLDGLETAAKPAFDISFAGYDIYLGQSAVSPLARSTNFASNYVAGTRTQLRSGALTLTTGYFSQTSLTGPNAFPTLAIDFNSGTYHYTGGDLIIELTHTGNTATDFRLDATPATSTFSAVGAAGYGATDDDGINLSPTSVRLVPVTQLQFTAAAAPEPGSLVLLGLGALGLALARRRGAQA
jgi:PEP-CTERM motif